MTDTERADGTGPTDGTGAASAPQLPATPPPPSAAPRRGGAEAAPSYETGGLRMALLVGSLAALGVFAGWAWVAIIFGVVVMIFLHELGHYATAKWSGMKVTEFFIGFGPRIWSFHRGETEYGLKAIPAGAYVRIIGMNNLDEADPADEARTYRQQSFPKRLLVVSAGSIMHMVQAFVLLVILLGVTGVPGGSLTDTPADAATDGEWEIGSVVEDSAAAEAGLRAGDRIVAFDGDQVESWDDVTTAIRSTDVGDEVAFVVERGGETRTLEAEIGPRPAGQGGVTGSPFLGAGPRTPVESIGLARAVVAAPGEMVSILGEAAGALTGFFSPDGLSDFAGTVSRADGESERSTSGSGSSQQVSGDNPDENRMMSIYGAVRIGTQLSEEGWGPVLLLFFTINIFIGILNMAPLPPLDGGHAAVAIYERIRSRGGKRYHIDMAKLMPLTYAVVLGLVTLGGAALYLDIVSPYDL